MNVPIFLPNVVATFVAEKYPGSANGGSIVGGAKLIEAENVAATVDKEYPEHFHASRVPEVLAGDFDLAQSITVRVFPPILGVGRAGPTSGVGSPAADAFAAVQRFLFRSIMLAVLRRNFPDSPCKAPAPDRDGARRGIRTAKGGIAERANRGSLVATRCGGRFPPTRIHSDACREDRSSPPSGIC